MDLERLKLQNKRNTGRAAREICVIALCSALILPGGSLLFARAPDVPVSKAAVEPAITPEQLDALVAPVALYPDNLLAQVLVATTYPLELIQLHQWLLKNPELAKDQKKLNDAVAKQSWDPSVQSMASLPDVVKWLAEDVQWTSDLGNAFLAQQKDVMDAVQRMRAKAKEKGTLQSNDKMKVETQVVESKQVIVIEPSNPEVVYVPSYDPVYVYGSIGYPYPPIYYPPYYYGTGAVWAAGAIGFGIGLAWGAAWGGWGWGCGWGGGDIDIDMNNNFNRNNNFNGGNRGNNIGSGNRVNPLGDRGGNRGQGGLGDRGQGGRGQGGRNQVNPLGGRGSGGKWSHDPSHRGGAPYGDRGTADRFGGSARGDSLANRQNSARQQIGRQGGNLASARPANRSGGQLASRGNAPGISNRASGVGNRGGSGFGTSSGVGNRSSGIGSGNRSSGLGGSNRSGGFRSGSSGNWGGSGTRMNSSRGSSSLGGSRGGFGGSRGGGGGFSRGGGGGRGGGGRGGRR